MSELEADSYSFEENNEREIEKFVGIQFYATSNIGAIGGEYKTIFKDFTTIDFSMTASDIDDNESAHSELYSADVPQTL